MYYIEFVNFCCFLQKYWHQHVVNPISINHYLRLNQFNDNINLEVLLKNSMAVAFDLEMYLRNYGSGFFSTSLLSLRPMDVEFMKMLHEKVSIVPVLAKADSLTPLEVRKMKMKVCMQCIKSIDI